MYGFQLDLSLVSSSIVPSKTRFKRSFPTLPNAPYVFTRSNGSKEVFMICPGDRMFAIGRKLKNAMTAVTTQAVVNIGFDGRARVAASSALRTSMRGRSLDQKPSSKQARAGTMVSQFRKERLPLRMRTTWSEIIITPAICRASLGQKAKNGAINSASQLNQTPIFKAVRGRK